MGRMIKGALALATYFCVATALTVLGGFGWLWSHGHLNDQKIAVMVAVARGDPISIGKGSTDGVTTDPNPEQPSLDEVLRLRALKLRDIELRESQINSRFGNLRAEQAKLFNNNDRYLLMKNAFKHELDALREGALAASQENARLILENMKPKQAKDQLMRMIESQEMDAVVTLLSAMPIATRKKIITEFKEEAEITAVADILKLIRQGAPEVPVIDQQINQLNQAATSGE